MFESDTDIMALTGTSPVDHEVGAQELPRAFVKWQMAARRTAYAHVARGERPSRFNAHLPVVATINHKADFLAHVSTKGTGFTPCDEHLDYYIQLIDECLSSCQGRPWEETLADRIAAAREFYEHPEHIDFRRLGLLEIFQGQTYRNLLADQRITLHYTGDGPEYPSFQINALAEIVGPEDKRFQFIYLVRQLFEHDHFHIHQPNYPFGYLAWVREVYDKSPFHGRAGRRFQPALPPTPMVELKEMLIPLDNSRFADYCTEIGLQIAGYFKTAVTGIHVYAAKLHDDMFRQMEDGLPPQYQEPTELERQRRIHDSLITRGLELISDSYLSGLAERCQTAALEFSGKLPEGKNYAALVDEINQEQYDIVVMGGRGLGETETAGLGSVTERVARRSKADLLVVKNDAPISNKIVVGVDGSSQSFAGIRLAVALGSACGATVEAVAAFDPHFHTVAFQRLEGILSEEAGKVFRFKEQEKLHNEIIDRGIAKIYRDHLETAQQVAADEGAEIKTILLEGKPYPAILAHLEKTKSSLLIVGRVGVHADEGLDLGATAENLLRLAPCHVLLVARKFDPTTGEQLLDAIIEGVPWTAEALERLEHVPPFARSFARKAIDDYAREHSITEVTPEVMTEVRGKVGM